MKALHIIESKTPGITRTRIIVDQKTTYYSDGTITEVKDLSSMKREKQKGYFKQKKILKIYHSPRESREYFVRHFM